MKPAPKTRRVRTLLMFLFAVTLVSILVVAVAWHYAILNPEAQERRCGGGGAPSVPMAFSVMSMNWNWTLTSVCSNKALHLSEVTMTIQDENGSIVNPMHSVLLANLAQANWATYQVSYVKVGSEDYVRQSAKIFIDKTRFQSGCRYYFTDYSSILYAGVLQ